MKQLFKPHFLKGYAFGIAYEKGILQIAFIAIVLDINFTVITDGFKRFAECLKDN